ncbi:pantothenate kinase 4-like isoform X1 [Limulus polyphemus]|uniref:4'-phosphopantetheine phosphatase n=1 Tax=Limulus polyphemus TaxID=6850 RepID=A0ABM1ST88_LIMPO|nr:pantothenate kinase 4-like isoform X1 [Limulus polyphemus]XP_022246843.1 pantothenate kinase 4-like isoform X1 [Limulus polyphemus]XP_022246844.1 pantothenate kinase 4-like isoform X1 [Limulus polyphemus]XP_022246845.1 pantothenate kinase 4-like isoform X1 [Limulus polyphemus]
MKMTSSQTGARSIVLPEQNSVFRNLKNVKRFAIDIGGSLTKIAYYSTVSYKRASYDFHEETKEGKNDGVKYEMAETDVEGARLHFVKFETKHIETCLSFIQQNLVGSRDFMQGKTIKATGGGAYKYTDLLTSTLGLTVDKEDEMECLIKGCNFLLKNIPDEVFQYRRHGNPEYKFSSLDPNVFPYLLCNIGSGVSVMKVESESSYERIGGSAMGGGTFWGLGSLLTNAEGFDELLELAEKGDHRNIDMLVKDIYGGDYCGMGLPSDLLACSFGKAIHSIRDTNFNRGHFEDGDIARSLLFMISNDIGQIACLYAMMHGLTRVYFGGYFLRGLPLSMHTISFAINYWSKGKVQALFLRHEGYLGAIGAFLKGAEEDDTEKYSWGENYAGSSGLRSPIPAQLSSQNNAMFHQLEMDRFDWQLVHCPLLQDPSNYFPDTVDLTQDTEARKYWLQCFEDAIDKFVDRAIKSQPHHVDAQERAEKFCKKYVSRLHHLRCHPFAYGSLTVRSLLDMREHCLNEFNFPDPYLQQKRMENEQALKVLSQKLKELDEMTWEKRQEALVVGLLAGNVFDWGAKEVATLLETSDFGFEEALGKLQARPWLCDNLDQWIERLRNHSHKCAAIFVDNSGMDVVLGVMPFARELIRRGTKVILCANSKPALNDVTVQELNVLMPRIGAVCDDIQQAFTEGSLVVVDSGQGSPCLDLSRLNVKVAEEMHHLGTDLILLEGMGRAIHTNLNTMFTCEVIKAAVLKNRWLANRLGGVMYSVIFKYERPS